MIEQSDGQSKDGEAKSQRKPSIPAITEGDNKEDKASVCASESKKDEKAKDKEGSAAGGSASNKGSQNGEEEEENNKAPLSDVWVFDTFLSKWFEIHPELLIQGSSTGKKIKKQFEPRLAHSSVILD